MPPHDGIHSITEKIIMGGQSAVKKLSGLFHSGIKKGDPTCFHVAIYLGDGRVVEAPQSGQVVRITPGIWQSPYWSRQFLGAVRPGVTLARS